MIINF